MQNHKETNENVSRVVAEFFKKKPRNPDTPAQTKASKSQYNNRYSRSGESTEATEDKNQEVAPKQENHTEATRESGFNNRHKNFKNKNRFNKHNNDRRTQEKPPETNENPEIIKENKEDGHVIALPYDNRKAAVARAENPNKLSLNGQWKFMWKKGVPELPAEYTYAMFDDSAWEEITVPGVWQFQKDYSSPWYYANSFPNCISTDAKKIPLIDHSGQEIAAHRRTFILPENWGDKEVFLHFGAVKSGLEVFVNGKRVGYSQGSFTPHEFNVTDFVRPGENQITAIVYRYTDGTYLEDQDMWYLCGIYREVYLFAEPKQTLRDVYVTTDLINNYTDADLTIEAEIRDYTEGAKNVQFEATLIKDGEETVIGSTEIITLQELQTRLFSERELKALFYGQVKSLSFIHFYLQLPVMA